MSVPIVPCPAIDMFATAPARFFAALLAQALGEVSGDLLTHAYDAQQALKSRASKIRVAKTVGKVTGVGGAVIEGGRLLRELGTKQ